MLLEAKESPKYQSTNEEITYKITTTSWGSSPSAVSATVRNTSLNKNVTSTVFPTNTPSVDGDIITLSPLKNLDGGNSYRVEVQFTSDSNVYECFFIIHCQM